MVMPRWLKLSGSGPGAASKVICMATEKASSSGTMMEENLYSARENNFIQPKAGSGRW